MEKLLVACPWNVDYRSGDGGQRGGRTPVTLHRMYDAILGMIPLARAFEIEQEIPLRLVSDLSQ